MNYQEYLGYCQEDNLNPHNILSMFELIEAKRHAIEIAKWNKDREIKMKNYPMIDWDKKMASWIKNHHERRVEHMFSALFFAEMMAELPATLNQALIKVYTKGGLKEPKL